jgi:hypothetical protein
MSYEHFTTYYNKPTRIIKSALKLASQLFCYPTCTILCPAQCHNHHPPNTLLPQFIIQDHHILPLPIPPPLHPPDPIAPPHPIPLIWLEIKNLPIHSIINHKHHTTRDYFHIIKYYQSYLCIWHHPNGTSYSKWTPQSYLFHPHRRQHTFPLLLHYYTTRQRQHFEHTILTHFTPNQHRDPKFIIPPLQIPLVNVSISECNPENDIVTIVNTIQVFHDSTYLYNYLFIDSNGSRTNTTRLSLLYPFLNLHSSHLKPKSYGSLKDITPNGNYIILHTTCSPQRF